MLGQKRNPSVFAPTAPESGPMQEAVPAAPPPAPVQATAPPIPTDEGSVRTISTENAIVGRAHNLFFTPEDTGRDFQSVLRDVQEYIATNYAELVTNAGEGNKEQVKRYITKYIQDQRIAVGNMTSLELVDGLYSEMAEFSFLTKYMNDKRVEEINIYAYNNIFILYNDGTTLRLKEHFASPEQAFNVIRRMLHVSGMILDNATPIAEGYLSRNVRIAALKDGIVDPDVGVAASIRFVNPLRLKKEDFIRNGTATEPMLDFLSLCTRYGISICVAGSTGSGKTTLMDWILSTMPDWMRIVTIEVNARELNLVRMDESGTTVNCALHTITKGNVTSEDLLVKALRFDPHIICPSEMRSEEAHTAVEAANTGHTVPTTTHSSSAQGTWKRIYRLAQHKYGIADAGLLEDVYTAFPIVVYARQLENMQRKITSIMECELMANGEPKFHTIYDYQITENRYENDKFYISGRHRHVSTISRGLQEKLIQNGLPSAELEKLLRKEDIA